MVQSIYLSTAQFQYGMCVPDTCEDKDILFSNAMLYRDLNISTYFPMGASTVSEDTAGASYTDINMETFEMKNIDLDSDSFAQGIM